MRLNLFGVGISFLILSSFALLSFAEVNVQWSEADKHYGDYILQGTARFSVSPDGKIGTLEGMRFVEEDGLKWNFPPVAFRRLPYNTPPYEECAGITCQNYVTSDLNYVAYRCRGEANCVNYFANPQPGDGIRYGMNIKFTRENANSTHGLAKIRVIGPGYNFPFVSRKISSEFPESTAPDFNGDLRVDAKDLNIIARNWKGTGKSFSQGDATGDGIVNAADLNKISEYWHRY
ncbi:hypothetical protein BVX98_04615 [bacterium F11]|nr:hypothetical protein BVX98_04615 [bacterium F11]